MKFKLLFLIIVLGISTIGFGQNLNMVIDVNDRLVVSEIGGVYLNFEYNDGTKDRILIDYHPGELILEKNLWEKIKSEETKKITLTFDYYTYKRGNQKIANFEVEMEKYHFKQRYLILHVYDFRERKYRKKYGCLTDAEYITEFNYPQGGILISCG
ncbi:hypothetical protein ACFSQ0_07315 [Mesonia sediminis]|uniref:Uncharacterized protein n=1 Tax=Mesonia sediminis TaxID=1703946 RepID=A0ABW5SDK8_9FLAO